MNNEPNNSGVMPNDNDVYDTNNDQAKFEDVYSDSNLDSSSIQTPMQDNITDVPTESVEYPNADSADNAQNAAQPQAQQPVNNTYQPNEKNNQYAAPQNDGQPYNDMPQNDMLPTEYYPQDNNSYYAYAPGNQQGYYGYNFQGQYGYDVSQEIKKERPPRYTVALTSMILGIASLVLLLFGCCCGSFLITWLPSFVGIILAFVSFSGGNKSAFATTGLITNAIAFVLSAIMIILIIICAATGNADMYFNISPNM